MAGETYIVVGPNGVGKSTLTEAIVSADAENFRHIGGSTVLKQTLGVETYEDLRQFSDDAKDEAFNSAMIQKLSGYVEANDNLVNIVDTHLLYFNEGDVSVCVKPWACAVNGIASVIASPDVVWQRIQKDDSDGTRKRSLLPPHVTNENEAQYYLAEYMEASRNFAHDFGAEHNIPVADIYNSSDITCAVDQFFKIFPRP